MYKSLIVSLNETGQVDALVEKAAAIARDHRSYVTGLYVLPAMHHPGVRFEPLPVMFEELRRHFADRAEMVRTVFESSLARVGVTGRFRVLDAQSPMISDTFAACARRFGLAIISEVDSTADYGVELDFVPSVLLASGRPVLVLPRFLQSSYGNKAVVGWNGSRESARAVFDALPLLSTMEEVHVITIEDDHRTTRDGATDNGDLTDMLAGHCRGVVARTLPSQGRNTGSLLLAHAALLGARLLVMGAYGRGRLAELVLGGATRHVLSEMKIPVLFSH
jgi:nucleotide-binding universal stress UspA family protein